jgi:hypothetical protein
MISPLPQMALVHMETHTRPLQRIIRTGSQQIQVQVLHAVVVGP